MSSARSGTPLIEKAQFSTPSHRSIAAASSSTLARHHPSSIDADRHDRRRFRLARRLGRVGARPDDEHQQHGGRSAEQRCDHGAPAPRSASLVRRLRGEQVERLFGVDAGRAILGRHESCDDPGTFVFGELARPFVAREEPSDRGFIWFRHHRSPRGRRRTLAERETTVIPSPCRTGRARRRPR